MKKIKETPETSIPMLLSNGSAIVCGGGFHF